MISLVIFTILALYIPELGRYMFTNAPYSPNILMAIIFLGQGFGLDMTSINKAFDNMTWLLITVLFMVVISNQINWLIVWLDIPDEAKYALAIFLSMPTTMNTGLVFTANVKGNVPFGLATVIIGQLCSAFTVPFFIKL